MTKPQYECLQQGRPELELPKLSWFTNWEWRDYLMAEKTPEQLVAEATAAKLAGEELFPSDVPF